LRIRKGRVAAPFFVIRSTPYRKDLFDAVGGAPKNWDDLRTALRTITKNQVYGYGFAGNRSCDSPVFDLAAVI
jgi:ABC-type glycerol-3-phosphate transport system substrate-binding protein